MQAETDRGVTVAQAAEALTVSSLTVRRMIAAEKIRAVRVSARRLTIPQSEITRILSGRLQGAAPQAA